MLVAPKKPKRSSTCQAGMSECGERPAGVLTYYRRVGGHGQPWVAFDQDQLCTAHAIGHRRNTAPGRSQDRMGWPIHVGKHLGQDVWQVATWWSFEDEGEACSTGTT